MERWRLDLYASELYHHGIKGQKWGERNGPPYPLEGAARKRAYEKMGHYEKQGRRRIAGSIGSFAGASVAGGVAYGIVAGMIAAPPVAVPALCVAAGAAFLTSVGLDIGKDVSYYRAGRQSGELNFRPEDYEAGSYANTEAKRRFRGNVVSAIGAYTGANAASLVPRQRSAMTFRSLGEASEIRRLAKKYGDY